MRIAAFFAGVLLLASAQPVLAVTAWGVTHGTQGTIPNPTPGQDIVTATRTWDGTNNYFTINLAGAPGTGAPNYYASTYGIYMNSGSGFSFGSISSLVGMPVDYYLDVGVGTVTISGPSGDIVKLSFKAGGEAIVPPDGELVTLNGISFVRSGTTLNWTIPSSQLAPAFEWLAASLNGTTIGAGTTLIDKALVPIPNTAWLLGAGVIALVGLKRRKRTGSA